MQNLVSSLEGLEASLLPFLFQAVRHPADVHAMPPIENREDTYNRK